jgi:signal transduction histidine kinase
MAIIGPDRRYQQVNEALCRLLEADATILLGWPYERLGHPRYLDTELDAYVRLAEGAPAVTYQRQFLTAGGHEIDATVHLCSGPEDRVLQMVVPGAAPASDATAGKVASARLAELASALSHDAQEPVRQIGVSAGLLGERAAAALAARERATLADIERLAIKLGRQMRGLTTFARLGPALIDPTPRELRPVVQAAIDGIELPAGTTVEMLVPDTLRVPCDPSQIRSAVGELLRNAVAFRRPEVPCAIRIEGEINDGMCTLRIHDNGRGMTGIDPTRLFRLFAASGPGAGPGVGLAIVRTVAEGHQGRVWATSTPDQGTTIHLSLRA